MKRISAVRALLLAVSTAALLVPLAGHAAESPKRRIAGKVALAEQALATPAELQPLKQMFSGSVDVDLMGSSQPQSLIVSSADGAIWFAAPSLGSIGRVGRTSQTRDYFFLGKGAKPVSLAEGQDRAIYAADRALNVIHRLSLETGAVTRIPMPLDAAFLDLASLRIDNDGKLWFAGAAGWIGSHDLSTGKTDLSALADLQGVSMGALAESGTIWFVAGKAGRMIRVDPSRIEPEPIALPEHVRGIRGISIAASGDVWISSLKSNAIARYDSRNTWRLITLPWPESLPQALLVRRDGSILIADSGRRILVRYSPDLDRFDDVGALGEGGQIKAMIELSDGVAIADSGADRIRIFLDDIIRGN